MPIQQAAAFEVNPGGRDALLAGIAKVKATADQAGASTRVATVTAGPNVGRIAVSTMHSDWETFASFLDSNPDRTEPVRALLRSANPPARLTNMVVRSELLPRDSDGTEQPLFTSALIFDPGTGVAGQATEALGATRDLFESLGSQSRIWSPANGPFVGRAVIVSGFDSLAGWARFRARLDEHTAAGNTLPVAPQIADGTLRVGGIVQTTAIDL